ncbi:MAG TPA: condensation domain-containing protein, partial [Pyrinomonadaceae bacterium]|nr:condensation domain-containing protein [Pyrinomonadaceae bacterium]
MSAISDRVLGSTLDRDVFSATLVTDDLNYDHFVLSYGQQRLWFLQHLEPNSAVYNIPVDLRLRGCLNRAALKKSLWEIVRRHESLRTTFSIVDGEPVQVIAAVPAFSLPVTYLSHLPLTERKAEAQREAMAEAQKPFNLSEGPLFRARLLKLGAEDHVLLLTLHHIISDGWSMEVLFKELSTLYSAYARREESPLAELSVQYADYAVWQREWLSEEVLEAQVKYWREQLRGAPAVLELPTDRPRPAVQSYGGQRQRVELEEELTSQLKELSRREGVTLFMTLLAAFQVLLWRYSGQQDIVVGTPTAGRSRSELEPLIGFFVNTLALRTELSGQRTFHEVLQRVKQVCLEAYAHQDLPFDRLVDELGLQRNSRQSPLVQVTFNLLNLEEERLTLPGLKIEPLRNFEARAKFDLTLNATEHDKKLALNFIFNPDLFELATIERLSKHFRQLLTGIVADPAQPASKLTVLSAGEREQVLKEWNDTRTGYASDLLIHEMFEQQAACTPERIALVYEQERFSYQELNERANRLGHYLRQQGVGPESVVGILLERSAEMVIALLATLKAGGAYLPLDPSYPEERLRLMLEDADTRVLLTTTELANKIGAGEARQRQVMKLDSAGAQLAQQSAANVPPQATADNLAYVIYTSGSTGTPKAAMNTHDGIRNRLLWMQQAYPLTSDDCVLQKTPYSFDVSVWEFFWPLMYGARLAVARPAGHKDAEYLREVIAAERVTTLHFVPSM